MDRGCVGRFRAVATCKWRSAPQKKKQRRNDLDLEDCGEMAALSAALSEHTKPSTRKPTQACTRKSASVAAAAVAAVAAAAVSAAPAAPAEAPAAAAAPAAAPAEAAPAAAPSPPQQTHTHRLALCRVHIAPSCNGPSQTTPHSVHSCTAGASWRLRQRVPWRQPSRRRHSVNPSPHMSNT